jgi:hypothetical protein
VVEYTTKVSVIANPGRWSPVALPVQELVPRRDVLTFEIRSIHVPSLFWKSSGTVGNVFYLSGNYLCVWSAVQAGWI